MAEQGSLAKAALSHESENKAARVAAGIKWALCSTPQAQWCPLTKQGGLAKQSPGTSNGSLLTVKELGDSAQPASSTQPYEHLSDITHPMQEVVSPTAPAAKLSPKLCPKPSPKPSLKPYAKPSRFQKEAAKQAADNHATEGKPAQPAEADQQKPAFARKSLVRKHSRRSEKEKKDKAQMDSLFGKDSQSDGTQSDVGAEEDVKVFVAQAEGQLAAAILGSIGGAAAARAPAAAAIEGAASERAATEPAASEQAATERAATERAATEPAVEATAPIAFGSASAPAAPLCQGHSTKATAQAAKSAGIQSPRPALAAQGSSNLKATLTATNMIRIAPDATKLNRPSHGTDAAGLGQTGDGSSGHATSSGQNGAALQQAAHADPVVQQPPAEPEPVQECDAEVGPAQLKESSKTQHSKPPRKAKPPRIKRTFLKIGAWAARSNGKHVR